MACMNLSSMNINLRKISFSKKSPLFAKTSLVSGCEISFAATYPLNLLVNKLRASEVSFMAS